MFVKVGGFFLQELLIMGCVYGTPAAIQDSKESPKEVRSGKGSVISRLSSSRRRLSFRLSSRLSNRSSDVGNVCRDDRRAYDSSRYHDDVVEMIKKKKEREKSENGCAVDYIGMRSIPKAIEGEQVAAGWPSWLSEVAGEAIKGWVPRRDDSFQKLAKIGQGTYSSVYKARDMINQKIVALKRIRFDNMDPESVKFMAREILILRRLDHPNVIKLEGLVTSKVSCSLCLVFEYMEHDLTGLAACPSIKFTIPQVKCYMRQLLSGLEHCHSRNVLHRDIKGSNLLIDNSGILKIADFGLASLFNPNHSFPMTSLVVTLWYRPPELLLGASHYGAAVDLWSAGCILGEFCSGKPIMPGRTEVEQMHKIFKLCGSPSDEFWRKSKLCHSTVFKPLRPYRRRLAEAFKDHPMAVIKLMDTLLSIEPELRGTATSALKSEFFTTKPLSCHPSSLPKYPPSKEMDAKLREEARRQRGGGGKAMRGGQEKRKQKFSRAIPAHTANAESVTSVQKSRGSCNARSQGERFDAQVEDAASDITVDPPDQPNYLPCKSTFSGPLVQGGGWMKTEKKHDDPPRVSVDTGLFSDLVATRLLFENRQVRPSCSPIKLMLRTTQGNGLFVMKMQDRMLHWDSRRLEDEMEEVKAPIALKATNDYFSGPLLVPSNNINQMLRDHEHRIREAARRRRMGRPSQVIEKHKG